MKKYILLLLLLIYAMSLFPRYFTFVQTIETSGNLEKSFDMILEEFLPTDVNIARTACDNQFNYWRFPTMGTATFVYWDPNVWQTNPQAPWNMTPSYVENAIDNCVAELNSPSFDDFDKDIYNEQGYDPLVGTPVLVEWWSMSLNYIAYVRLLPDNLYMSNCLDIGLGDGQCTIQIYLNANLDFNCNNSFDFQSVLLHEMCHALGIYHIEQSIPGEALNDIVMQPTIYNQTRQTLTDYDIRAYKALYLYGSGTDVQEESISGNESLLYNFPNPFNPTTQISYSLAENPVNPSIEIFNVKGQRVKTFRLEEKEGTNSVTWQGKDETGTDVASGVYMYRLINNGRCVETKKMMLLK